MGRRRKQNGIEVIAALPWPMGIAACLIGFLVVRYVLYLTDPGGIHLLIRADATPWRGLNRRWRDLRGSLWQT